MCIEAAQPARINAAIVMGGGPVRVVRVEYGKDHLGRWMNPDAERVLARSIYRRLEEVAPKPTPEIHHDAVAKIVSAACYMYNVSEDQLLDMKVRKQSVKYARAHIAHELKRSLGLSEKVISTILRFKHKSCVAYWLSVPSERLRA